MAVLAGACPATLSPLHATTHQHLMDKHCTVGELSGGSGSPMNAGEVQAVLLGTYTSAVQQEGVA